MGCDEVLGLLREREAACRGEAVRLRGEATRIAELLLVCEEELARVATVLAVVGGPPALHAPALPVVAGPAAVPAPRAGVPGPGRGETREAAAEFTERVLEVLAGARGPVRCGQMAGWLGLESSARNVERVRHHLKRAVKDGRAVATPGGLFAPLKARAATTSRG
ncbi:hypothetical protein [Streptomyces sp. H27-D2]|uniref:hypothetical protein n=1 Tax=Streptomyces sp. H27-D2 TaxID=3046304 RepID=UPI002DBD0B92|nr:hypothetical protein [Streptomyces sp. H27-D2]MEC4021151.1 hypothetical protein [Streptomyces sp. H27-D2]